MVVTEGEFPTVGQVWVAQKKRSVRLDWVPARDGEIPPEGYERLLDENTLLVSACHAYYQSGFKQDIPTIVSMAREVGAMVYVDAYQCLGTEPFDVKALDVDFLASGMLKYLMGVPGIAFLEQLVEKYRDACSAAQSAEGERGIPANIGNRVLQQRLQRLDRGGVTELSQGMSSGLANAGVFVRKSQHHGFQGARIAQRAQCHERKDPCFGVRIIEGLD